MSKNVEHEVHSHDEAILWLWRAHNKVNKRLSKEPSTDPRYPKIAYPPKDLCTECAYGKTGDGNIWNDNPSVWKKNIVLNYLKAHYGVYNIRLSDQEEESAASDSVRFINSRKFVNVIGFGMTYFDTSLCVVVYGAGVMILIMLYIYVLRRRGRVKHFSHMA